MRYAHRRVDLPEPVEVIRPAHAYRHLAGDIRGWAGSTARRLVGAVVHAATQRLPGYAEAAWHWTRPPTRTAPPIGLCRSWTPVDRGVTWLPPAELAQRWGAAALVLLTADSLGQLPPGLPPRPGVYLCALRAVGDDQWPAVARLAPDLVVLLPAGGQWLLEQVTAPCAAVQQSELAAAGGSRR